MTDRERAICSRVRLIREEIKWSQIDFAKETGISRPRLASIEYAHTPLRYDLAHKLAYTFNISLKWLATGNGEMHPFGVVLLTVGQREELKPHSLLSEVYDLMPGPFEPLKKNRRLKRYGVPADFDYRAELHDRIRWAVRDLKFKDLHTAVSFLLDVLKAVKNTKNKFLNSGLATRSKAEQLKYISLTTKQSALTPVSEFRKSRGEMNRSRNLPWLIKELKRLTEPSGMKSKLAEYLKVPQARVSEWLSEKYIPSGDVTLRMLQWVENPEERK